jgi:hypothetical protein
MAAARFASILPSRLISELSGSPSTYSMAK